MPSAAERKRELEAARAERLRLAAEAAEKEEEQLRQLEELERRETEERLAEEARRAAEEAEKERRAAEEAEKAREVEAEIKKAEALAAIRKELFLREAIRTLKEAEEADKAAGLDKAYVHRVRRSGSEGTAKAGSSTGPGTAAARTPCMNCTSRGQDCVKTG
jgi:colicin import membrane protein